MPSTTAGHGRRHDNSARGGMRRIAAATLTDRQFVTWGWRVPFLASGLLLAVGPGHRRRPPRCSAPTSPPVLHFPKPGGVAADVGAHLDGDLRLPSQ